ncbi:hypothetical protein ACWFRJ_11820 [Streptomyces sp. NPDC055239]
MTLFLLMGAKQRGQLPREGHEAKPPGWMRAIDFATPGKCVISGPVA